MTITHITLDRANMGHLMSADDVEAYRANVAQESGAVVVVGNNVSRSARCTCDCAGACDCAGVADELTQRVWDHGSWHEAVAS